MINKIKIKLLTKSFIISLLAFFAVAAIASAVTTIGANISTDGTLSVAGISTLTGNVGIGTASPGSALDVKGTLRLSGSTSGYVGFAPAAAAGSATYTLPAADGVSGQMLSTNGSGVLSWAASSSQTPWGSNINAAGYTLYGNSTASGNLTLGSTSNAAKGFILLNPTGGDAASGASVGIGTTTPATTLHLFNSATASSLRIETSDTTKDNYFDFRTGTKMWRQTAYGSGSSNMFDLEYYSGSGWITPLTILTSGNIGIGTASPSSTLDVLRSDANDNILSVKRVQTGADGGGYLDFRGGASGTTIRGYLGFTSTGGFGTPTILTGTVDNAIALRSNGYLYFGSGGDNIRMTIREDGGSGAGYIGIGTTNPAYQLQVQSAQTTGTVIGVKNTDTGGRGYGLLSSGSASSGGAGKLHIYDDIAGIRLTVDSAGNVGIGTSAISSGQKLEINGGVTLATATSKPACNSTTRGTFWAVQSGAGVKDTVEVCAKDAADAYAWRTIY